MKLPLLFLFIIFLLPVNECTWTDYFENIPVVGAVAKKTAQITHYVTNKVVDYAGYVKETGRSMKDKVKSYFVKDDIDLEAEMTTPQILVYNGYPSETHTIATDDGYILTVHRIPFSKHESSRKSPSKTVLLHHGILGSSADWIIAGQEKGLAYILSDFGYDVWMANVRGNTYSKAHMSLSVDSYAFWNFTFHDVSQYDLPAVIDYIRDVKGPNAKINYVGFSMGTTILFALLSTKTEYNNVLNAAFTLAPIAYMGDVKSPIRMLTKYNDNIEYLMNLVGANEFLPQNEILTKLYKYAYKIEPRKHKGMIFKNIFFVLCGHDEAEFDKSLVPSIMNHVPAGTSTKTLVHYAQEIAADGNFQQFDYGYEGNWRQYRQIKPPDYPVDNITLPTAVISATNDWLSGIEDVKKLYSRLANPIEHYVVPYKDFNHIDFLWSKDVRTLVYDKLLEFIENYNNVE